jgi:hypothetical protein
MPITSKETGGDYELNPEGLHSGVCCGVYDLGTHYSERFNKSTRKVLLCWELPKVRMTIETDDGAPKEFPKVQSKQYTNSLHKRAKLRQDLEVWRGKKFTTEELKGFDLTKLLGVNCNLQIMHNDSETTGQTYANVTAVMPIAEGQEKFKPEREVKYFSFEDHTEIPKGTPEWIEGMIKDSKEWPPGGQKDQDEDPGASIPDDDIPF